MARDWIVVRTQPRREAWAQKNIERQGCSSYFPRFQSDSSVRPLFPSYLFVEIVDYQWYFLRGTFGVVAPIMTTNEEGFAVPAIMPASEIDRLKAFESDNGIIAFPEPPPLFSHGQRVTIKTGPWIDQLAEVMSNEHDRVRVLLSIMGKKVPASFHQGDLALVA